MPLVVDRARLPENWPTNAGPPAFWEELGRTLAAFTHLEDMLARSCFGLTGSRRYASMDDAAAAFPLWEYDLKETFTDTSRPSLPKLGKALKDDRVPDNVADTDSGPPGRTSGLAPTPCVTEHGRVLRRMDPPRFATSGRPPTDLNSLDNRLTVEDISSIR